MTWCDTMKWRCSARLVLALFALLVVGCDLPFLAMFNEDAGPAGAPFVSGVMVRVENRSGFGVTIETTYQTGDLQTRDSRRHLAADGVEAVEEIPPTTADSLTVTVRVATPAELPEWLALGDIYHVATFERDADFVWGETLVVIIPPPGPPGPEPEPLPAPIADCNANGTPDAQDIASGTSADCDEDGMPDECQSSDDANHNGVPDVCEPTGDMNDDGQLDVDDIQPFIDALLDPDPGPSGDVPADINRDGAVDGRDVQPFVVAILSS